jgi:hypothetical protein
LLGFSYLKRDSINGNVLPGDIESSQRHPIDMNKQLAQTTSPARTGVQDVALFESALPFAIGFVTRDGDVMGACLKFAIDASSATIVHLNTAQTAALICSLTELRSGEHTGWMPAIPDDASTALPLAQREIDTVRRSTVARHFEVSAREEGVAIRFVLMTGKHVDVQLTCAAADQWLKRMDASISQLELLRDATGAMC